MPPIRLPQKRAHSAPPAGFLNTNSRVRRLYQQLLDHNARGEIVTYNVSTDSWQPWTRYRFFVFCSSNAHTHFSISSPVRIFRSGAMTEVAASGFRNLPDYEPPVCPHASDLTRDVKHSKMELYLRRKYQGRVVDYFQAPKSSHFCPFVGKD
jgi:hypothetical protein